MFWESSRDAKVIRNEQKFKDDLANQSVSETNAYPLVPDSEMTIEETEVIDLLVAKSPLLRDSA